MDVNNYSHDQEPRRCETISAVTRYIDSDIDNVRFCYFPTRLFLSFSLSLSLWVWFFTLIGFLRSDEFSTLELANGNFLFLFFFLQIFFLGIRSPCGFGKLE